MSGYTKRVDVKDMGFVSASVFGPDGNRVHLKLFYPFCFTLEAKLKASHAWADRVIAQCIKYRVNVSTPPTNTKEQAKPATTKEAL